MPNDENIQWVADLGKMGGVPTPLIDARLSGGVSASPASAKSGPAPQKPAPKPAPGKGAKGGAPAPAQDGPLVLDLDKIGGRIRQVRSDPDDPDSPMIDTVDIPMPPRPLPDNLPSDDITIQFLQKLPDHAAIMAGAYGTAVASACHAFESYADNKIEELAGGEEKASMLIGALASGVLTLVGGAVAEKVAEAVGEAVAEAIKDAVKDGLVDTVKEGVKPKNDAAELRNAVRQISQKALDLTTIMHDRVKGLLHQFIQPPIDKLRAHIQSKSTKPALTNQEAHSIYPYVRDDDDGLDMICVQHGVPDRSSAKDINVRVYGELVRTFELKLRMRRVHEYIEKGASPKVLQELSDEAVERAKKDALVATKQRRATLDKMERAAGG